MLNLHDCTKNLIGLEDVVVENIEKVDNFTHIHIIMHQRIHDCPKCGRRTSKIHDYRTQIVKAYPAFDSFTLLHIKKRRHVCKACGKKFYESVSLPLEAVKMKS